MKNKPEIQQFATRDQALAARRASMSRDAAEGRAPVGQQPTQIVAGTWDAVARTVQIVLATEEPVIRADGWGEAYQEILACGPENVDVSRCNAGTMALVIDHGDVPDWGERQADSVETIRGRSVENSAVFSTSAKGYRQVAATFRVNETIDGDPEYNRAIILFERGFLPNTSVRPNAREFTYVEKSDGMDILTATKWEPLSQSFVATPQDANCLARAHSAPLTPRGDLESQMPEVTATAPIADPIASAPVKPAFSFNDALMARAAALKPQGVTLDELHTATLGAADADAFTDKVISHLAARSGSDVPRTGAKIEVGNTAKENLMANLNAALFCRSNTQAGFNDAKLEQMFDSPNEVAQLKEIRSRGAQLRNLSALQAVRATLAAAGDTGAHFATDQELSRAFLGLPGGYQPRAGSITTGDLSSLAANLATKTLVPNLKEKYFPFEKYCLHAPVKDFKLQYPVTFDGITNLTAMSENQKYTYANLSDSKESFQISKYGKGLRISDQMILADDLGALRQVPMKLMQAALRTRVANFFAFLAANAALSDGNALFSAAHLNVLSAYQAPTSIASIDAQRVILKAQLGKQGEFLELMPWMQIVGDDVLTGAQQATGAFYAPTTVVAAIPSWAGKIGTDGAIQLSGASTSYMFADPSEFPAIVFATLEGAGMNGLNLKSRVNFDNDSFEITLSDAVGFGAANSSGNGVVRNKTL